jgi:hypothetical protein
MSIQKKYQLNGLFIAVILMMVAPFSVSAQQKHKQKSKKQKTSQSKSKKATTTFPNTKFIQWEILEQGLYFTQLQAPRKTKIGDYKVDVLKVDPKMFDFELNSYVLHDTVALTAPEWSAKNDYLAVINAGMYTCSHPLKPVGFMKSKEQLVNPRIKSSYNAAFVFGNKNSESKPAMIADLGANKEPNLYGQYTSALQSIRMIDCNGRPTLWKSRPYMRCSMGIIGQDKEGFIYLIFMRSPFKPNEMSVFLSKQPLGLTGLMYLEGGPETSYVINHPKLKVERMGCYVSHSWQRDNCSEFRRIPQVIGVKRKG